MLQTGPGLDWYFYHVVNMLLPYAVAAVGITLISLTPLGRAAIGWLKGHINRGRAAELAGEIEQLRAELAEVHERLDFAERQMVAQGQGEPRMIEARPKKEPRTPTPA